MLEKKSLRHETPHWVSEEKVIFFITVCCKSRGGNALAEQDSGIAQALVESVKYRNDQGIWWCTSFIVMPDHVHGLIQFSGEHDMAELMKSVDGEIAGDCVATQLV